MQQNQFRVAEFLTGSLCSGICSRSFCTPAVIMNGVGAAAIYMAQSGQSTTQDTAMLASVGAQKPRCCHRCAVTKPHVPHAGVMHQHTWS